MMRMHSLAAIVFCAAAVCSSARAAHAIFEYCPAKIGAGHHFAGDGTLYSFVLSAQSSRRVEGTILAQTDAGWFTIPFPQTPIVHYLYEYHTPYMAHGQRDAYYSQNLYVRFPAGVTRLLYWSVLNAHATGDAVFDWDQEGRMTCAFVAKGGASASSSEDARFTVTRDSPPAFDLWRLPSDSDMVLTAVLASDDLAPTADCAQPFTNATPTKLVTPSVPMALSRTLTVPVRAQVELAISKDGKPDDAWIFISSGSAIFDALAVAAARESTFLPATAFCKDAPGFFLYSVVASPN